MVLTSSYMPLPTTIAEVVQQQLGFESGAQIYGIIPGLAIFLGLAVMVTVLAFSFLGDGLRDALDPRSKL